MYTLDTNAIIYYLRDEPDATRALNRIFSDDVPLYVSAITETELFGFPNLTDRESAQLNELLGTLAVIPLDSQIARIAGRIRGTCRLKIADAVIAATALFTGSKLLTRNLADFKSVPDLEVQRI